MVFLRFSRTRARLTWMVTKRRTTLKLIHQPQLKILHCQFSEAAAGSRWFEWKADLFVPVQVHYISSGFNLQCKMLFDVIHFSRNIIHPFTWHEKTRKVQIFHSMYSIYYLVAYISTLKNCPLGQFRNLFLNLQTSTCNCFTQLHFLLHPYCPNVLIKYFSNSECFIVFLYFSWLYFLCCCSVFVFVIWLDDIDNEGRPSMISRG